MRRLTYLRNKNQTNHALYLVISRAARLLALLLMLPGVVQAQFTYTTTNGAITITGYTGSGPVTIPSMTNCLRSPELGKEHFKTYE
jgi:Tfp pilus assembly pilus retraction ATPase PilT